MLRTASMLLTGALLAGCQNSTGVWGAKSFERGVSGPESYAGGVSGQKDWSEADRAQTAGDRPMSEGVSSDRESPERVTSERVTSERRSTERSTERPMTEGPKTEGRPVDAATSGQRTDPSAAMPAPAREAQGAKDLLAYVDAGGRTVTVYNESEREMSNVKVWLNRKYFTTLDRIPPRGSVSVERSMFLTPQGDSLVTMDEIKQVELQRGETWMALPLKHDKQP